MDDTPVLLFLDGLGEVGSSPNPLPLLCLHLSPPFQAMLDRLPNTIVIAPQAPAAPAEIARESWGKGGRWRSHCDQLAELLTPFAGRRIVTIGFSRGGLGVLQLVRHQIERSRPKSLRRWANVMASPLAAIPLLTNRMR